MNLAFGWGQYRTAIRDAGYELSGDESDLSVVLNARVKGFDELAECVDRNIEAQHQSRVRAMPKRFHTSDGTEGSATQCSRALCYAATTSATP